jgi:membrane protease YdiL (CAAX protease family)
MTSARATGTMTLRLVLWVAAVQALLFAVGGWLLWRAAGPHSAAMLTFAPWEVVLGLALAGALIGCGMATIRIFPAYGEWLIRSQAKSYPFLKNRMLLSALVFLSLCAGLGEEMLFRGGVQTLAASALPAPLAIALASLVFAAIHLARPLVGLLIALIGALFGVAYWWSGSLLAVMTGHAVYDIWALYYLQEGMHRLRVFGSEAE